MSEDQPLDSPPPMSFTALNSELARLRRVLNRLTQALET
jgi:hypothetical protein